MSVTPEKYHPRKNTSAIVSSSKNILPIPIKIPKLANKPKYEVSEATDTVNIPTIQVTHMRAPLVW